MKLRLATLSLALCCAFPLLQLPASSAGDSVVAFDLVDNRPLVVAMVNGTRARVAVDTGGVDALDDAFAKKIGLDVKDNGDTSGAGEAQVHTGITSVRTFTIGSIAIPTRDVGVIDFSVIAAKLRLSPFDGLIGYETLRRVPVTFAYSRGELIFGPRGDSGTAVPFTMYGTLPLVSLVVDGHAGQFAIDTGDRSSITLFPSFARRYGFEDKSGELKNVVTGWGIGGPIHSNLLNVSITFAGHVIRNVVGRISLQRSGAFADNTIDGTIGGGLLKHFDVTFDYSNKHLWLVPHAVPPANCSRDSERDAVLSQECQYQLRAPAPWTGSTASRHS